MKSAKRAFKGRHPSYLWSPRFGLWPCPAGYFPFDETSERFYTDREKPIKYPHVSDRIRTVRLPYHRALTVSYPVTYPSCDFVRKLLLNKYCEIAGKYRKSHGYKKHVPKTVTSRNTRIFIR
jgi:hypothetical protein